MHLVADSTLFSTAASVLLLGPWSSLGLCSIGSNISEVWCARLIFGALLLQDKSSFAMARREVQLCARLVFSEFQVPSPAFIWLRLVSLLGRLLSTPGWRDCPGIPTWFSAPSLGCTCRVLSLYCHPDTAAACFLSSMPKCCCLRRYFGDILLTEGKCREVG